MSDRGDFAAERGLAKIAIYAIVGGTVFLISACLWCFKKCYGSDDKPQSNAISLPPPLLTPEDVARSNPNPGVPYPRAAAPPPRSIGPICPPSGAPYPAVEPHHPSGAPDTPYYSAGTPYPATGSQIPHPSPAYSGAYMPQPSRKGCSPVGATLRVPDALLSGTNYLTVTEPAPPPSYEHATSCAGAAPMPATNNSRGLSPR